MSLTVMICGELKLDSNVKKYKYIPSFLGHICIFQTGDDSTVFSNFFALVSVFE